MANEDGVVGEHIGDHALRMANEHELVRGEVLGGVEPEVGSITEEGRRDEAIDAQGDAIVGADPQDFGVVDCPVHGIPCYV